MKATVCSLSNRNDQSRKFLPAKDTVASQGQFRPVTIIYHEVKISYTIESLVLLHRMAQFLYLRATRQNLFEAETYVIIMSLSELYMVLIIIATTIIIILAK